MSNFMLRYGELAGIQAQVRGVSGNLDNCANRLRAAANALNGQSGFGVPNLRAAIENCARDASRLSSDANSIAAFLVSLRAIAVEHENQAHRTLVDVSTGDTRNEHIPKGGSAANSERIRAPWAHLFNAFGTGWKNVSGNIRSSWSQRMLNTGDVASGFGFTAWGLGEAGARAAWISGFGAAAGGIFSGIKHTTSAHRDFRDGNISLGQAAARSIGRTGVDYTVKSGVGTGVKWGLGMLSKSLSNTGAAMVATGTVTTKFGMAATGAATIAKGAVAVAAGVVLAKPVVIAAAVVGVGVAVGAGVNWLRNRFRR